MKFDHYSLPIKNNGDISESAKDLGVYFLNIYLYRQEYNKQFTNSVNIRKRLEEETDADYTAYINAAYQIYQEQLQKLNIQYMDFADIHLVDKVEGLMYSSFLKIHPDCDKEINALNLIPILSCLYVYDITGHFPTIETNNIIGKSLLKCRKNKLLNTISDICMILSISKKTSAEYLLCYLAAIKKENTWTSKLFKRILNRVHKNYGNFQQQAVNNLMTE